MRNLEVVETVEDINAYFLKNGDVVDLSLPQNYTREDDMYY